MALKNAFKKFCNQYEDSNGNRIIFINLGCEDEE